MKAKNALAKLGEKEYVFIEVPNNTTITGFENQSQIISTTNNITEELAESIVDKFAYNEKLTTYKDYMYLLGINPLNEELFDYMTALDSFKSFMNSLDLDITRE